MAPILTPSYLTGFHGAVLGLQTTENAGKRMEIDDHSKILKRKAPQGHLISSLIEDIQYQIDQRSFP